MGKKLIDLVGLGRFLENSDKRYLKKDDAESKYVPNWKFNMEISQIKQGLDNTNERIDDIIEYLDDEYLIIEALEDGDFTIERQGNSAPVIYYAINDGDFQLWDYSDISLTSNDKLKLYGNNERISSDDNNYSSIRFSGEHNISGNIYSLLNKKILEIKSIGSGCFFKLFSDNVTLKSVDKDLLKSNILSSNCFGKLFENCVNLINAPKLQATVLKSNCYQLMFSNCVSLTTPPELPAEKLEYGCYIGMFKDCASLKQMPVLKATKLTQNCYSSMFSGCISLREATALPATELASSCYYEMFSGCINLITAPQLPATTLQSQCYYRMFYKCKSLKKAPDLNAETLVYACYKEMFWECASLQYIKCLATNPQTTFTDAWFGWGPDYALFISNENVNWNRGSSGIPNNWYYENYLINYNPSIQLSPEGYLTLTSLQDNLLFGLYKKSTNQTIYISKNATDWMSLDTSGLIQLNNNEIIYICGDLTNNNTESDYTQFAIIGKCTISGNCNYIWNKDNSNSELKEYCGRKLFSHCSDLDIDNFTLPSTTLSNGCYYGMFELCKSLSTAPVLSASTLTSYCYAQMFKGCVSLLLTPQLPAETLNDSCYFAMFSGCSSITTPPSLSATTMAQSCYNSMFSECISLSSAPQLPATSLANGCYNGMFSYCISLVNAPDLPTVDISGGIECYREMFDSCYNLNMTQYELPATFCRYYGTFKNCVKLKNAPIILASGAGTDCPYMFYNCLNLREPPEIHFFIGRIEQCCYMFYKCIQLKSCPTLKVEKKDSVYMSNCCSNMFYGCKSITDASNISLLDTDTMSFNQMFEGCKRLKNPPLLLFTDATSSSCCKRMFYNCTSLEEAPEMNIERVGSNCFSEMFSNCTSLTNAPQLPSINLSSNCYEKMFYNCKKLTTAPELPARSSLSDSYRQMFYGCSSLQYIKCAILGDSNYYWMYNVAPIGTFVKSYDSQITYNASNGIPLNWDIEEYADYTTGTFGGYLISPGPIAYENGEYVIKDNWNYSSYNSIKGKNEGSTYFSYADMGELFYKQDFSNDDRSIKNLLDPFNGWRLPTSNDVDIIFGYYRKGSTVNNVEGKTVQYIKLTDVTYSGSSTPGGLLVFPDGLNITGKSFNTDFSVSDLNEYINQGCVFIPAGGYYSNSWRNGGSYIELMTSADFSNGNNIGFERSSALFGYKQLSKSTSYLQCYLIKKA